MVFRKLVFVLLIIGFCIFPLRAQVKVACIGNSITENAGVKEGSKYPQVLQSLLGDQYEVRNFGVGGRTLLKKGDRPYWNELKYEEALQWLPDIVIIKLGTNDSKPQNWKYSGEFKKDYLSFVKSFKHLSSNPRIYLCFPIPVFEDKWGIRDSVLKYEVIPIISKVARRKNLTSINLYNPFVGKPELVYDGVHPNAEGAHLMAEIICKAIRE